MTLEKKTIVNREFVFTQRNFEQVASLIEQFSGISLSDRKVDMVYSRLARRLRIIGLKDFDSYLAILKADSQEKEIFINALTTNLTHFFREKHHFDYLSEVYLPELFAQRKKRLRFWSAGCSTGEEPYTLSMVWHEQLNKPSGIDFKILATDLDTNVLEKGKQGFYSEEKLKPIDEKHSKWFKQTKSCKKGEWQIDPQLRKIIYFKQLNLMSDWPMKGPFELIVCRNVLIYFDKPTQQKLVHRFYELLCDNGCLMLGHSENLSANKSRFEPLGATIYRKV